MKTKIGMLAIDLAKGSFQVRAIGADGEIPSNRAMSRTRLSSLLAEEPACVVAMEACATSRHWGRLAQSHGHEARLVPAAYVKPFVKRQSEAERGSWMDPRSPAERPGRCGGHRRGGHAPDDAVRGGEERGDAGPRAVHRARTDGALPDGRSAPASVSSASARSSSTPCGVILPSSASSRRKDRRA